MFRLLVVNPSDYAEGSMRKTDIGFDKCGLFGKAFIKAIPSISARDFIDDCHNFDGVLTLLR